MIARPHPQKLTQPGLFSRLAFRIRVTVAAAFAGLFARDSSDEPTRFSPDAWKAWDERGTL